MMAHVLDLLAAVKPAELWQRHGTLLAARVSGDLAGQLSAYAVPSG